MSEVINEYNLISSHLRLFYFYKLDFIIQNEVFVIPIPLVKGPLQLEKTTKVGDLFLFEQFTTQVGHSCLTQRCDQDS